jgi:hypothetical protein
MNPENGNWKIENGEKTGKAGSLPRSKGKQG